MEEDNANSMKEMIVVLSADNMESLGSIRTWPGLLVSLSGDQIWVRGIPPDANDIRLRKLPAIHTYLADFQERLFLPGKQTPHDALKRMTWESLASFIKVELPVSALPGSTAGVFNIKLAPSAQHTEPAGIITSLEHWKAYADSAPLIRLQGLVFAACGSGEVLIMGTPVPPIPGQAFTLHDQLLLPAGYDFDPPAAGVFIAAHFKQETGTFIRYHRDGSWEKIPGSSFVHATRSAIRLTNID